MYIFYFKDLYVICLYVCLSGLGGKRDFLGPYICYSAHFLCAHSSCIGASILLIFCPSVRVQKAKELRYLWMLSFLLHFKVISKFLGPGGVPVVTLQCRQKRFDINQETYSNNLKIGIFNFCSIYSTFNQRVLLQRNNL